MLRKLLKHELYATGKNLLPIYGITLILSLVNRILTELKLFSGPLKLISNFMMIAYVIAIIATLFVTFVIIILRFYKNLMTDEGYLMFTLPVKPSQLINSKLISSILWNIVSVVIVGSSLLILLATPDRMYLIREVFDAAISELKLSFGNQYILLTVEFILLIIISIIQQILLIYVSIAIGHLFSGHKVLGSFASYIAINTIIQVIITLIMVVVAYFAGSSFEELDSIPQTIFPLSILISLVLIIIYYITTNYIFNKKLNLE